MAVVCKCKWRCRLLFEGMLLAVVLNYCYGTNEDRRPPNPFPGQDPNADCDQLQWHCRMSVSLLASIDSHGRNLRPVLCCQ